MPSCLWLLTLSLGVQALRLDRGGAEGRAPTEPVPAEERTPAEAMAFSPALEQPRGRLLIFIPVGSKNRTIRLMARNIDHLRTFEDQVSIDVFLAHYDGDVDAWRRALGSEWYDKNVQFNSQVSGIKMWLAKDLLLSNSTKAQVDSYNYVWLLDEDAGLETLDLWRMLILMYESNANIATPAFINSHFHSRPAFERTGVNATDELLCQSREVMCKFQLPTRNCHYRYTNFVEVSFVLIKPAALRQVLGCEKCLPNRKSTWGLNRVWCGIAAGRLTSAERSCAIIDETPILHYNFRTHAKYRSSKARMSNAASADEVEHAFPQSYVKEFRTFQCVVSG